MLRVCDLEPKKLATWSVNFQRRIPATQKVSRSNMFIFYWTFRVMIPWKSWWIIWLEPLDEVGINVICSSLVFSFNKNLRPCFSYFSWFETQKIPHFHNLQITIPHHLPRLSCSHQERRALPRKHHRRSGPKWLPRTDQGALENNSSWAVTKGPLPICSK